MSLSRISLAHIAYAFHGTPVDTPLQNFIQTYKDIFKFLILSRAQYHTIERIEDSNDPRLLVAVQLIDQCPQIIIYENPFEIRARETEVNVLIDIYRIGVQPSRVVDGIKSFRDQGDVLANVNVLNSVMSSSINTSIWMGIPEDDIIHTGLLSQFWEDLQNKKHIYLIGGYGGFTKILIDYLTNKEEPETLKILNETQKMIDACNDYKKRRNIPFLSFIDTKATFEINRKEWWKLLNNGLSQVENELLFKTTDSFEIVSLLENGMISIAQKSASIQNASSSSEPIPMS